jgi:hypothetical protein
MRVMMSGSSWVRVGQPVFVGSHSGCEDGMSGPDRDQVSQFSQDRTQRPWTGARFGVDGGGGQDHDRPQSGPASQHGANTGPSCLDRPDWGRSACPPFRADGGGVHDRRGPVDLPARPQLVQHRAVQPEPQPGLGPGGEPAMRGRHAHPELTRQMPATWQTVTEAPGFDDVLQAGHDLGWEAGERPSMAPPRKCPQELRDRAVWLAWSRIGRWRRSLRIWVCTARRFGPSGTGCSTSTTGPHDLSRTISSTAVCAILAPHTPRRPRWLPARWRLPPAMPAGSRNVRRPSRTAAARPRPR